MGVNAKIFGFKITAKDDASAVLKGVVRSIGAMNAITKGAGGIGKGASEGVRTLDHAFGLAAKGGRIFREVMDQTVAKSMETRSALDPARQQFQRFEKDVNKLRVSMGDALIPVLAGFVAVLDPVVRSTTKLIDKNRDVIAIDTAKWAVETGTAMIDVLAPGIQVVITALSGLRMLIPSAEYGFNSLMASVSTAVAATETAIADSLNVARGGSKEAIIDLRKNAAEMETAARIFTDGADESQAEIVKIEKQMRAARGTVGSFAEDVKAAMAKVVAATKKAAAAGIGRIGRIVTDPMMAHVEAYYQAIHANALAVEAQIKQDRQAAAVREASSTARSMTAVYDVLAQRAEIQGQISNAAYDDVFDRSKSAVMDIGHGIMDVIKGTQDAGQVMLGFFDKLVDDILESLATGVAKQIAELMAAQATAKAASVGGGIFGFLGSIFGFASGGIVPSTAGRPGVDSVPALLSRNEEVLTPDDPRHSYNIGRSGLIGGGGTTVIIQNQSSNFIPETNAEFERRTRTAARVFQRAGRRMGATT